MTDVELIKSKLDIASFLSDYIQLKKTGRNFKALCPFHSEKTPSFIVSAERQSWHCFGACGEGGDVITFLQKWENIEFVEALKILAQKTGVTLSHYTPTEEGKQKELLYEINHLASEFYHFLLTSHSLGQKALDYLSRRGIKKETIKAFTLGYAPNSWESLNKFLIKKGYAPSDIYTAGLILMSNEGKYYDRFRGRLMFALKDHRGNIVGFSGRLLNEEVDPEREPGAKYINTSETPIYIKGNTLYGLEMTKEAIKKEKEAVVVEGEFDFLSSYQSGVSNVVAIKGTALTSGQTLLLTRYTDQLLLALDSDFAGSEAAKRGIEIAENAGLTVKIVELPTGKDPADCIAADIGLWKKSIKTALPIYDFIIKSAFNKYSANDAVSKKKIGSEVIPFLSKIENSIQASHYIKTLSKQLEVSEESIETAIRRFQKKPAMAGAEITAPAKQSRDTLLEEHLLSLISQSEDPKQSLSQVFSILSIEDFFNPPAAKIMEILSQYFKTHEKLNAQAINSLLTPEISPVFDKAFMIDMENILKLKDKFQKELHQTAREIKKRALRRRVNALSTKIRQFEEENNDKKIEEPQQEIRMLLQQIKEVDKK